MANYVDNLIDTSGQIIGRYEWQERVPSVEVAGKLADDFGVTLDYLVDHNKEKYLMKQSIIEVNEEKREAVQDIQIEAMEDVAMILAIQEGKNSGNADRDEIFGSLQGAEGAA